MQLRNENMFETIKKNHKKQIVMGAFTICLIGSAVIFTTTRAKYRNTQSINIVKGTVNYKLYDYKILEMYQENNSGAYSSISSIPSTGYEINNTKSYCTVKGAKDSTIGISYSNGTITISNSNKKEAKCYLYFDKIKGDTVSTILAKYTKAGARTNYKALTTDNSGKVYSLEDDDGISFYFAGAVTDNWVKFADTYWRIIRFNGDGTIRLIYSGNEKSGPATKNADTGIVYYKFNDSASTLGIKSNVYVGYRYTSGEVHGTKSISYIQGQIDSWYKTNIVDRGYSNYVDINAGFCGDRDSYTDTSGTTAGGGTEQTVTYYGAYTRFVTSSVKESPTPTFKCKYSSDLYTVSGSSKGNKSLTYPVALITADEVNAAGGIYGVNNNKYYLYTYTEYWTMTPSYFTGTRPEVFVVTNLGKLSYSAVNSSDSVRPVINLRADTTFKSGGDGTSSNPYEVS